MSAYSPMSLPLTHHHRWDVSLAEAEQIQSTLCKEVCIRTLPTKQQTDVTAIAFADDRSDVVVTVVTVDLVKPTLEVKIAQERACFPYLSGYLAFHCGSAVLKALSRLNRLGNVIIVNAHGLAHPRRCGFASHLGVLLDHPTVGCARSLLPGNELKPSEHPLVDWVLDKEGIVGIALYTQRNRKPVILSIGHRMDIDSLLAFAHRWLPDHRQPMPIRLARSFIRQQIRLKHLKE